MLCYVTESAVTAAIHPTGPRGKIIAWQRVSQALAVIVLVTLVAITVRAWISDKISAWDVFPVGVCLFAVAAAFWLNGRLHRDRELAEKAARASEEQYRRLFNSMEEGFCTIEVLFDQNKKPADYRFLEINDAFEKHTGLVNAKGKRMRELAPDHEQHWFDIYGNIALTGISQRFENRAEALGRWYEVHAFRVGDPAARTVGIVFSDITERKGRENEMREAREQAERASNAKDEFLAALSHELRTPLTPVLMTASELRDDERLPDEARDQLAMMKRNIELEARLIDDLLDLTQIVHGKLALRLQPCDTHSLVALAVEMVRSEANAKRQQLAIDLRADRAQVMADPARLQQVFWNLLKNAVKFTPERGHVTVRSQQLDGKVVVEIADDGVGIAPEAVDKIFLPFEQSAEIQKDRRYGGLGLGLSITKAIIDQHGAEIGVHSDGIGRGATFRVELELTDAPVPMPDVSSVDPASNYGRPATATPLRVLLVEDHDATIQVLRRLLTREGHEVKLAMTCAAAKHIAKNGQFDIVISDLGLPDGTGFELMQELHGKHGLRGIALSGYGMEEDLRRSKDAGFVAHLIKPVDFEQLRQAVNAFAGSPT